MLLQYLGLEKRLLKRGASRDEVGITLVSLKCKMEPKIVPCLIYEAWARGGLLALFIDMSLTLPGPVHIFSNMVKV
jgi:hypothetical protein